MMKKIYFLFSLLLSTVFVWAQTNNYFGTTGTINGNVWNTNPAGPYTNALVTTGGAIINFGNAATPTGASITVVGINATANTTWTGGGTLATGGTVATIDVAPGITLSMAAQNFSTAAGTGFIKNGAGTLLSANGNAYPGGFVMNAGTMLVGGVNAMGGAAGNFLTWNGGIISSSAGARTLTNKFPAGITIGGNVQIGEAAAVNPLAGTGALTFTNNVSLGAATRTITIGNIGNHVFSGVISNSSGGLTITANANGTAGSVILSGANTYSGTTTVNGGTLTTGAANTIPAAASMTLGGGTLKTGTAAGFTQSTGTLNLAANSTIALGTGVHTLSFANSSAVPWTAAQTLTITGWTGGYDGTASATAGRIFVGTDATGLTAGQLAQITFRDGSNNPFPAVILSTGEVVPGPSVTIPDILLASNNPAVAAGNIAQGSTNNVIYSFSLAVTTANATLNGVTINTAGTYAATDFTNFRCWYSADNIFSTATDVLLSTITPAVAGTQAFTPFTNQNINNGTTGYIFITASVPCVAVVGNTISVNAITTADITFTSGNKTGTAFAGDVQTIIAGTPNDVTVPAASVANASSSLSWTNPAGCYDEILIVAAANTNNTGTPTGDGTAYTGNLAFAAGTPLGNGFVVYKGVLSPQVVNSLTNGVPYFYKFFTRLGTVWSAGVEVSATPALVSVATDYFRSVTPGGPWGSVTTWESSPDNVTWIAATLTPTALANTITIRNNANVTVAAAAGGDQVVVDAGASLILNANFTLADGAGTDLTVNGTVTNISGTHTLTGTTVFNANSVYQHNRNGAPVLTATWNPTSTVEINGITATQPTNLGQTFGNFTWNSTGQTGNIGLGSPAGFDIAGNLTVTSTGGVTNRAFRFTSNTAYTLSVGGNLILNGGHLGLSSGTGTMSLIVAGDVSVSNNSELYMSQGGSGVSTLSILGNLSVSNATITETGSSTASMIIFNKNGTQTFSAAAAVLSNDINYTVVNGSTLVLNNSIPVNTGRSMIVDGILDCGILSVNGTGSVTVNNGGRVRVGSLNVTDAVADNISATGGLTLNTGSTVEFNGLAAQFAAARTFSNLQINNSNGVTLTGAVLVTDILGLTSGVFTTSGANLLTMDVASLYTGGNSNASYVFGPVKKIGNTPFTFPIGKSNGFVPLRISNFTGVSAATDEFTAEYVRSSGAALGTITDPFLNRVSGCEYWTLTLNNGTPTVDVTLFWNANNPCGGTYIANTADLEIAHFDGTNWNSSSTGFSSLGGGSTNAAGDITWSGVTTFSPFTLASKSNANPLPIVINYLNGTRSNGNHLLNWKVTCVSVPSATIEVERSTDGRNYNSIYSIFATALRCQQPFDYTDNQPAKGVNYYRLKMTDADGKVTYSTTVTLINAVKGIDIMNIAPNPIVNNAFNLKVSAAAKTTMQVVITDMQGRILQQQTVNLAAGFNSIPMYVGKLAAGTYQLVGNTGEEKTKVLRFVIQ